MKKIVLLMSAFALVGMSATSASAFDRFGYFGWARAHNHANHHIDLHRRAVRRAIIHHDAHHYPMTYRQHERLHDRLDHDAFHDRLEHREAHRSRAYSPYRSHFRRGPSIGIQTRFGSFYFGR